MAYKDHHLNYEQILSELCNPESSWSLKGTYFPSKDLSRYRKIWNAFLYAKLMPSKHTSDVTKEKVVLLYSIINDCPIDVGLIIHHSIRRCLWGPLQGGLPHPSLICGLCARAGVKWSANEPI